jgi:hypothetical protein
MKTTLPAGLPIVDIVLLGESSYAVTVQVNGTLKITGISSPDYQFAREGAEAVAEGIAAAIGAYPICAYPIYEEDWCARAGSGEAAR